jgi:hypothetical protein
VSPDFLTLDDVLELHRLQLALSVAEGRLEKPAIAGELRRITRLP